MTDDRRSGTHDRRDDDGPLSSGVLLLRAIENLEARMVTHNQNLRADMYAGFSDLRARFSSHEQDDLGVERRVTVIETERDIEQRTASKHGAIAGTVTSGLVLGLAEAFRRLFGHP